MYGTFLIFLHFDIMDGRWQNVGTNYQQKHDEVYKLGFDKLNMSNLGYLRFKLCNFYNNFITDNIIICLYIHV